MAQRDFFIFDKESGEALSENIEDYPAGLVIPLDKPYGWTSADAVRKIKFLLQRHFHKKKIKVGHAGTLDPLATGILLICVGKATKMDERLQSEKKEYIAKVKFGATTPSYDLEKEIDRLYPYKHITKELLEEKLCSMVGVQMQVPPLFSAKFVDGVRAYEKARAGEKMELEPSRITIYDIKATFFELPDATLTILCSKGTYIRSVARDIGESVGSGAHLTALVRSKSGEFTLEKSLSMEKIEEILNFHAK